MPTFNEVSRGKEFDEIRSWIFGCGGDLFVCHSEELKDYFITTGYSPTIYIDITAAESEHALRVLGCISGAFKTQGESNT